MVVINLDLVSLALAVVFITAALAFLLVLFKLYDWVVYDMSDFFANIVKPPAEVPEDSAALMDRHRAYFRTSK